MDHIKADVLFVEVLESQTLTIVKVCDDLFSYLRKRLMAKFEKNALCQKRIEMDAQRLSI